MNFYIYLIGENGVRAREPVLGASTAFNAKRAGCKMFIRFVILDAAGVQVFASDTRDETGAYLPHGL